MNCKRAALARPVATCFGHGKVRAPGAGVIAHIAGLELPEGIHRGVLRIVDDPQIAAAVRAGRTA